MMAPTLAPGLDEGVVRGVLGFERVAHDRPRQPVGPIEVLVRQQQECRVAAREALVARGCAVGEIDDVGRAIHDDKTPQPGGTFSLRDPPLPSGGPMMSIRKASAPAST